jgi:uncharacterized protein YegJ (DUF2314 family)
MNEVNYVLELALFSNNITEEHIQQIRAAFTKLNHNDFHFMSVAKGIHAPTDRGWAAFWERYAPDELLGYLTDASKHYVARCVDSRSPGLAGSPPASSAGQMVPHTPSLPGPARAAVPSRAGQGIPAELLEQMNPESRVLAAYHAATEATAPRSSVQRPAHQFGSDHRDNSDLLKKERAKQKELQRLQAKTEFKTVNVAMKTSVKARHRRVDIVVLDTPEEEGAPGLRVVVTAIEPDEVKVMLAGPEKELVRAMHKWAARQIDVQEYYIYKFSCQIKKICHGRLDKRAVFLTPADVSPRAITSMFQDKGKKITVYLCRIGLVNVALHPLTFVPIPPPAPADEEEEEDDDIDTGATAPRRSPRKALPASKSAGRLHKPPAARRLYPSESESEEELDDAAIERAIFAVKIPKVSNPLLDHWSYMVPRSRPPRTMCASRRSRRKKPRCFVLSLFTYFLMFSSGVRCPRFIIDVIF